MTYNSFVNRDEEIGILSKFWESNKAELVIVWGRRRIGKTRLLLEFSKGKRSLYLYVFHASASSILGFFSKELERQLGLKFPPGYVFPDWDTFYKYLSELSRSEKIIVIIDEFQRLADSAPEAIELLQFWWDKELSKTKIKLFLVGSSIGMIEKIAISGTAPLFGRKTGILNVKSMSFFNFAKAFRMLDPIKLIELYSVFGGTPHYFIMIDPSKSVEDNIVDKIASPYSPLRDEPENILRAELRSLSLYMDILEKLSFGHASSVGEIASSLNKSRSELYPYLIKLEKMDIISRVFRPTDRNTEFKRARFKINDNFFRFWFRFIYPNYNAIEGGDTSIIIEKFKNEKNSYVSNIYEDIVRDFLMRMSSRTIRDSLGNAIKLPKILSIGSWWWKDTGIDICAVSRESIILGEVKWRDKQITKKELEDLVVHKTSIFLEKTRINRRIRYIIALKKIPRKNILDLLAEEKIYLITPEILLHEKPIY